MVACELRLISFSGAPAPRKEVVTMRLLTSTLLIAVCWAAWPAASRADETRFIRGLYKEYFNRTPAADEVLAWRDMMEEEGLSRQDVRIRFLASDEYYDLQERDRSRLVRALFKHLAGRAPNRGEVELWLRHW